MCHLILASQWWSVWPHVRLEVVTTHHSYGKLVPTNHPHTEPHTSVNNESSPEQHHQQGAATM